jgi:hypothetical protein
MAYYDAGIKHNFYVQAYASAPSNPTHQRTACPKKASKKEQSLHIHPEDGNCNVCRNVG